MPARRESRLLRMKALGRAAPHFGLVRSLRKRLGGCLTVDVGHRHVGHERLLQCGFCLPLLVFSLTAWSVIANPTDAPIFARTFLLPRQLRRPDPGVARGFPRIWSASEKERGQSRHDCQMLHKINIRS